LSRDYEEKEIKREAKRSRNELKKWLIASIVTPNILLIFQYLYFGEITNRPFISILPQGYITIKGNHIEHKEDGSTYEDKSRKDVAVQLEFKNGGKMPANSTLREIYLSYESQSPFLIRPPDHSEISISPVQPLTDTQSFMVLNKYVNDFILEVKVYYYGKRLLGMFFAGRPYIHYCRIRWYDNHFNIEETKDIR
jgi:hypothetical protein